MSMAQFAPRRIIESPFSPYPEGSYCLRGSGDVITNGYIPASPPYTPTTSFEQSSIGSQSPSEDTDTPCSPGLVRTYSYDKAVFDFRRIPPEKIAAQITLLDLPLFKAVTPEELRSCGWTRKDKRVRTPNVVNFTQRFNHTSYWVMDEVLNEETQSPKVRAEIISQFIRITKKLYELNNLHSLKAIIAGLQSVPIYRLSQTWGYVSKKDMCTYNKMVEFLSQEDNWKRLRDHMAADKLPCIPYLGLFLTDLCFTSDIPSKRGQFDTTCNLIAYFQNSTYDDLLPESHIQKFLTRTFFIDELQRAFEDEKYRLSLKYEPISSSTSDQIPEEVGGEGSSLRLSKSFEDLLGPFNQSQDEVCEAKTLTPVVAMKGILHHRHSYHNIRDRRSMMTTATTSASNHLASSPSLSSHSKSPFKVSKSSKTNTNAAVQLKISGPSFDDSFDNSPRSKKGSTLPKDIRMEQPNFSGHSKGSRTQSESEEKTKRSNPKSLMPWKIRHRKAHSLGGNALSTLGIQRLSPTHSSGEPQRSTGSLSRSLIDDDEAFSSVASSFTPTGSTGNLSNNSAISSGCSVESSEVVLLENDLGFLNGSADGSRSTGIGIGGWCSFEEEDDEEGDDLEEEQLSMTPILEGELKRKLLKKAGKNVSQLKHRNRTCWVQLNQEYLLLLGSRPHKKSNKAIKVKGFISRLKDCRVKYKDPSEKMNDKQFILVDDDGGHIRFEAKSAGKAMEWVEAIREAIHREEERERQRVNQSLIQFN